MAGEKLGKSTKTRRYPLKLVVGITVLSRLKYPNTAAVSITLYTLGVNLSMLLLFNIVFHLKTCRL